MPVASLTFIRASRAYVFRGDDRHIYKVLRQRFELAAFERERAILRHLKPSAALPIPSIIEVAGADHCFAYPELDGVSLFDYWKDTGRRQAAGPWLAGIAAALAALHAVEPTPSLKRAGHGAMETFLTAGDRMAAALERGPHGKVAAELREAAAALRQGTASRVVVHGDVHPGNIVVDPATGNFAGLVDFGAWRYTAPEWEFARFLLDWPDLGRELVARWEALAGRRLSADGLEACVRYRRCRLAARGLHVASEAP